MKRILLLLALSLLPLPPTRAADDSSPAPKHFKTAIGGFLGTAYRLDLQDDGTLDYTVAARGGGGEKHTKIKPSAAEWKEFRATLDALKIWQWQPRYAHEGVLDGTQWLLDVSYADRAIRSEGSNNYPEATGQPNHTSDFTPAFTRYLAAVEKLIGGLPFK